MAAGAPANPAHRYTLVGSAWVSANTATKRHRSDLAGGCHQGERGGLYASAKGEDVDRFVHKGS